MQYLRVCGRYKTKTHEIQVQDCQDYGYDAYEPISDLYAITPIKCCGKKVVEHKYIIKSCNNSQCCEFEFYLCYNNKTPQQQYLVHPASFSVLKEILHPTENPFKKIEEMLDNWIKYNPLSGSMIKIVREDFYNK